MKSEKSLVSICIPVYNGEDFLKETLDSVINQTYSNIEIVITDDLSVDGTEKIIRSYDDKRIRYFKNDSSKGLAGNWNEAVSKSGGEYIKVLCQDDLLTSDAIEKQVLALEKSNANCVIGNTKVINSRNQDVFIRKYFKEDKVIDGLKFARKSLLGRNIYSEPGNILYRSDCFKKYGNYDTELSYTPDWEFALRISVNGTICCISDFVFSFRISESSETTRLYKKKKKALIADTDKMLDKIVRNKVLNLNAFDIFLFKFNIRVLAVLRGVVLFFQTRRGKEV